MTTSHDEVTPQGDSYIQEEKLSQSNSAQDPKDLDVEAYEADYREKPTTDVHDVAGKAGHSKPSDAKYKQLSWIRLTSVLIVEAIALGS